VEDLSYEVIEDRAGMTAVLKEASHETVFGSFHDLLLSAINSAIRWPSTFIVMAFDEGVLCGISSGQFVSETEALGWWTIRAEGEKYRGLGQELFLRRNMFSYSRGITVLYSTANSPEGRKMIESGGGWLIPGHDDEYEHMLISLVGGGVKVNI